MRLEWESARIAREFGARERRRDGLSYETILVADAGLGADDYAESARAAECDDSADAG